MGLTQDYIEELFNNTENSRKVILSLLEDQYYKMEELALAKNEFRVLFDESPIALWEEDFSEVKNFISKNCPDISELESFLNNNPENIYAILSLVKVINVNNACLTLYKATSKSELLENLSKVFTISSIEVFKELIINLFNNNFELETETINSTLKGESFHVKLKYKVIPGYEDSLKRILVSIVDISKEKLSNAKLKESEQRFIEAQKIAKMGNWTFDHLTNEIKRSNEIYNILEINKKDLNLTFESFLGFIHKDDLTHYQAVFNESLEKRKEYEVQYRIITPTKKIKFILEKGKTLYNEQKLPLKTIGTAQDITERILVENKIKESQSEYQVLFDNAPIALFEENFTEVVKTLIELGANESNIEQLLEDESLFNQCIKLIFVNNINIEALNLFKASSKEEFHKNLPNLFSKHAVSIIKDIFIKITQGLASGIYETTFYTITGELFDALVRFSVLKYKKESGKLLFSVENITLRKKLLKEIEEKQNNLNLAQQIALIGSFSLNHADQSINRTDEFYRIFEATREQLPTREECFLEFVHKDDRVNLITIFHDSISLKIPYEINYRIITTKGNLKYIHEKGSTTYDTKGNPIKTIGTLQDVTSKTIFQNELNKSREILERTLYNMTDGFVSLDKNWIYTNVNPKAAEMLDRKIEDLLGKHFWTEFPEVKNQPFYKNYSKAFETQQPINFEDYFPPLNRWFENRVIPSPDGISIFFQDITERKLATKKLEDAYAIINQSNSIAISWHPSEGYPIKYISENCEKILGYTAEELINGQLTYDDLIYEKDKARVLKEATFHNQINTPDNYTHTPYRIKHKNGQLIWVKDSSEIQRDENGNITQTQGFVEDINIRYQAELELNKTHDILEKTLNTITEGFVTFNEKLVYTYANPQAAIYLNKTIDELIGKNLVDLYPESKKNKFYKFCKEVIRTKKYISFEEYYTDTNRWFYNRVFPNQDGISIFFKDITDQKIVNQKLEQAFKIINNSKTLLYTIKNDDNLEFEYVSDNAYALLGYSPEEIYSKNIKFYDLIHPDDVEFVKSSIEKYIKTGNRNSYFQPIFRIVTKDGTIKFIKDRVDFNLNEKFKITSFNGIFEDFTEQYLTENKLKESHQILENTLTTITEGFLTLDHNWLYTNINPQAAIMLEYNPEELLGKNIWEIDPEVVGSKFYNNCHLSFETQKPIIYDEYYKPFNKWFENRIYPSKKGVSIFFQDITDKKIVNDKIKEANNVINNSNSIAIVWENIPTWPIKYISENVQRILGYTVNEMLTEIIDFSTIMHSEDLEISNKEAFVFLNDTKISYYTLTPYRVFTKDGKIRWISERTTVKRDESGNAVELHGFIDDITEQYILENSINTILNSVSTITGNEYLKEITIQLNNVLNADYTFIGLIDSENPQLVNTKFVCKKGNIIDNFSYDLSGTPCFDVLNLCACSYATDVSKDFPNDHLLAAMGIEGYVGVPLIDSHKNVIGILVGLFKNSIENTHFVESIIQLFSTRTGAEIERLKTEEKLLLAEKAFAQKLLQVNKAIDAAKDVVFMTDTKGVFNYINPSFKALYGYCTEDLIGKKTPRILKSDLNSDAVYSTIWSSLLNKKPVNIELINKTKSGKLIDIESTLSTVVNDENEIVGFVAIQRDVTEKKKSSKTNEILLNIAKKIPEIDQIGEFSKIIKSELANIIDTSNFYLALYNENTKKITIPYMSDNLVEEYRTYSEFDAEGSLTGYLISQKKSLKVDSAFARKLEKEEKIKLIGPDSAVWLGVPLINHDKVIGAIAVQSYENENAYDAEDQKILEIIAEQVAIALERIQNRLAIKANEEKFRSIFELSPEMLNLVDINGIVIDCNIELINALGYSDKAEVIGKPFINLFAPSDKENAIEKFESVFKNGSVTNIEHLLIRKDRTEIPVEISATLHYDENNIPKNVIGIARDITLRKRDEKLKEVLINISKKIALTNSLAEFSHIVKMELSNLLNTDNFYIGLYNKDNDTISVPFFADDLEYEFKGNDVFEAQGSASGYVIKTKKPLLASSEIIKDLISKNQIVQLGPISAVWLGVPLFDKKEVIGIIAVQSYNNPNEFTSVDQTILEIVAEQIVIAIERIQSQQKIKDNEEKFRSIFELSPDMVNLLDMEGNLLDCNNELVKQLGYASKNELIGKNYLNRFTGVQKDKISLKFQELINNGQILNQEHTMTRKDGSEFAVELSAVVNYDEHNLPKNIIGIGRDITQRKLHDVAMEEALNRAMQADKLKSAFLANMSHEIRTPMNGIIGFAEMLKDKELNPDKRAFYSNIIMNSSKQLLSIINDILDMSTIEAGLTKFNYEAVSINNLLTDLQMFFSKRSEEKGLDLLVETPLNNTQSVISTDATKVQQIFTNLINNAIKFTSEGSIKVGYTLKDNFLEFYVSDTGKGIEDKFHNQIFERFSQVDQEYTKETMGNGLGLSICKRYVELLGGEIWLKSKLNEGSHFYFTLPYNQSEINEKIEEPIETEILSNKYINPMKEKITILVAEDEEYNQIYIEEILDNQAINILFAENGLEAIEIVKQNQHLEFILMDIKMPVMNGIEASKKIREFNKSIPIIALTAFSMESDKNYLLSEGFDDYLAKPIVKKDLLRIISKFGASKINLV